MGRRRSEINLEKEMENLIELFGELVMDAHVCRVESVLISPYYYSLTFQCWGNSFGLSNL